MTNYEKGNQHLHDLCLNIHEQEDNQLNRPISKEIFSSILHN